VSDRQRTFAAKPTGDGRLDSLAAEAALDRIVLEVLLVAAVCSKPSEGVAVVEAAGAPDLIAQPDLRAIYEAVWLVLNSEIRPVSKAITLATMLLDDDGYWRAAPYTSHWGDCITAASWWPNSLVSLWTAKWEFPELDPVELTAKLIDVARRQQFAMDHYRHACRMLAGAVTADTPIEPSIYDLNPVRTHLVISRVSREMAMPLDVLWGEVVAAQSRREERPRRIEAVPAEDQPDIEDLPGLSAPASVSWLDEITSLEIDGEAA
jgi:hypothetical protein